MRKTLAPFMVSALALSFTGAVYAQDTETSASTTEMDTTELETLDLKEGEGLDEEIQNARMRATSGSRSKISMSTSLSYSGGSIEDPLSEDRPKLDGDPSTETATDLGGSISARYRFSDKVSATLGAGVGVLKPLHGAEQMNIDNPGLGLSRYYKLGIFQASTSASVTAGTSEAWKDINQDATLGVSQNMMAQVGNSNFTAGASLAATKRFYSDDLGQRIDYTVGFYPQLEYAITDKLVARTVFGYFNYFTSRESSTFDLSSFKSPSGKDFMYQSVGLGIVATRDIYIYPNIQFLPNDFGLDKTNVAISATINLF
jgi:hypothetical protein